MNHTNNNYAPQGARHDAPFALPGEIHLRAEREDYHLAEEAQTVRDAFESQTNGMMSQALNAGLDSVESSYLTPWCSFITVLDSLYRGKFDEAQQRLRRVEDNSGPGLLKPVIHALCGSSQGREFRKEFRGREKELYNKVAEDRNFVKSVEIQLKDTLEAGEEYFHEFALLALKEIKELDVELSLRLGLWILRKFYLEEWDYETFLEDMKLIHPSSVVMRLSALVLTPEEREEGIKCWLLSLLFRCREGVLTQVEAAEYLQLVDRLWENLPAQEEREISQLLHLVGRELETFFAIPLPAVDSNPLEILCGKWASLVNPKVKPVFHRSKITAPQGKSHRHSEAVPCQLELFSMAEENEPEPEQEEDEAIDFTQDETESRLLSPAPLEDPRELRELLRTRPRYVGPELWFEVIKQKRKQFRRAG